MNQRSVPLSLCTHSPPQNRVSLVFLQDQGQKCLRPLSPLYHLSGDHRNLLPTETSAAKAVVPLKGCQVWGTAGIPSTCQGLGVKPWCCQTACVSPLVSGFERSEDIMTNQRCRGRGVKAGERLKRGGGWENRLQVEPEKRRPQKVVLLFLPAPNAKPRVSI